MVNKKKFVILLYYVWCISWLFAEPLVQVSEGILKGTTQVTRKGRKISSFLGIPYAQPPIRELRFRNPLPAKPWNGIRNATKNPNECPQTDGSSNGHFGNEDCLYLNVHTPLQQFNLSMVNYTPNKTLLPVMAWIHGGEFVGGNCSSAIFGAGYLLDKDIILVSMNYRLGILGFLSSADSAAPGNFGLKDQVLALKWIQKNIRVFGGDPDRVTIFGESAGGVSVHLHALSDASNGLFHQYIIQSGSALSSWTFQPRHHFKPYIKTLALITFCPVISTTAVVNCLRKKSVESLLHTSYIFGSVARFSQLTWTPTDEPDAEGAFLLDSPENLTDKGKMKDYPFITGTVKDEGLITSTSLYTNRYLYFYIRVTIQEFFLFVADYYLKNQHARKFTKLVKQYYLNDTYWSYKDEFISSMTKFMSDAFFFYPELRFLEIAEKKIKSPFYFYSFDYRGTFSETSVILGNNKNIGVSHGDDLMYLFPTNPSHFHLPNLNFNHADESISEIMIDLWTSFAINGKPTSRKLTRPDLWEPYIKKKNHLQIGNNTDPSVTLTAKYFTDRMNFWKKNLLSLS